MGDVSSAIPNDLIVYGGNAESHNGQLREWAANVTQALDALRRSRPDPALLPSIPDLGASLNAYAVKKQAIDRFVYDVGMAFFEASGCGSLDAPVTIRDQTLDHQLDQDEGSGSALYRYLLSGKVDAKQALAMIEDDPVMAAAFFKEMGAHGILQFVRDNWSDAALIQQFDETLGIATQSPVWDPEITNQLANGDWYQFEDLGPPEQRWTLTAQLLRFGIYSDDVLTRLGDEFLFHGGDNGIDQGAEYALGALARNPDVALEYLTAGSPDEKGWTRLQQLLDGGVGLGDVVPGGEDEYRRYQQQIDQQLGVAVLAANGAPDATPDSQAKLLSSISRVPVSVVPDGFRDVVTQLIGLDIDLMGDKLPSSDPAHPQDATNSPLGWEERQRLFLIAMYGMDPDLHQLVPDQARVDALREEVLGWAMRTQSLNGADPTVWLHNAASMNALLTDGLAAFPYYQEELARQQEEFNSVFAGVVFSVALPLGGVGLVGAGVGELTTAGIEAATHIALDITERATQDHLTPAWEVADQQVNSDLITARSSMVVSAYEHDPNAAWVPDSLRGRPLDDPALERYLASVAMANDTSDLPDQYKHGGTDVPKAGQLITQLNAYSGLFKLHDPHQVQDMLQH